MPGIEAGQRCVVTFIPPEVQTLMRENYGVTTGGVYVAAGTFPASLSQLWTDGAPPFGLKPDETVVKFQSGAWFDRWIMPMPDDPEVEETTEQSEEITC